MMRFPNSIISRKTLLQPDLKLIDANKRYPLVLRNGKRSLLTDNVTMIRNTRDQSRNFRHLEPLYCSRTQSPLSPTYSIVVTTTQNEPSTPNLQPTFSEITSSHREKGPYQSPPPIIRMAPRPIYGQFCPTNNGSINRHPKKHRHIKG